MGFSWSLSLVLGLLVVSECLTAFHRFCFKVFRGFHIAIRVRD